MRDESFRITREITVSEIDWDHLQSVVARRNRLADDVAERLIVAFMKQLRRTLNLHWFLHPVLREDDRYVALGLCEHFGADRVVLTSERSLRAGVLRLSLAQKLKLAPFVTAESQRTKGREASLEVLLSVLGRKFSITSLRSALFVHGSLLLLAIVSLALVWSCLLYAGAVLGLFLMNPAEVTVAATQNAKIGIALLCVLVVMAGAIGRGVKKIFLIFRGKGKAKKTGTSHAHSGLKNHI